MKNKIGIFVLIILFLIQTAVNVYARPIARPVTEKPVFYHTDAQGTPVAMTDSKGKVVWRGNCLPFGEEFAGSGTRDTEIRYAGKPYNSQLGLYDFGARYYDPSTGRFTGAESVMGDISDPQRLNSYAYGLNSPYKYIDPDGRIAFIPILIAAGVGALLNIAFNPSPANAPPTNVSQEAIQPAQTDVEFLGTVAATEAVGYGIGKGISYGIGKLAGKAATEAGVMSYKEAKGLTAGLKGEMQAHHLVEARFAEVFGAEAGNMPAVVMSKAEHQQITNALRERLPYGGEYKAEAILEVYQKVYSKLGHQDWLKAIETFLKK